MKHDDRAPLPVRPPSPGPLTGPTDIHVEHGQLGNVPVVPDDYRGPLAPGSVRAADYARMVAIYGNIVAGSSSLQVDTSNYFRDDATGEAISPLTHPLEYARGLVGAIEFRAKNLDYLRDLVKTPAGLALLEQLDGSKYSTSIVHGSSNTTFAKDPREFDQGFIQPDGSRGTGMDRIVAMNPDEQTFTPEEETCATSNTIEPWMRDRPRFALYHELVHAFHFDRGDATMHASHVGAACASIPTDIEDAEFQAVGLGNWASEPVSENAIRAQLGAPLRPTYGGSHSDDPPAVHPVLDP